MHKKSIVLNVFADQVGLNIKHNNFGDDLNFYLVSALTGKQVFFYDSFFHFRIKNYVCIGSIVEDMANRRSIIWGGGVMNPEYKSFCKPDKVLAVRGPLTRTYLIQKGVQVPEVYGDPALLTPLIYKSTVSKNKRIGIIPHFSEINNPLIKDFVNKHDAVLVDLKHYDKWTDVIDQICQCDMIASSSLHGLILSDAYGVPNVWMCLNLETGGGEFKYKDYFSGVHRKFERYMVDNEIELQSIIDYCNKYQGITFDQKLLIDSCPFLSVSKRVEYTTCF